MPIDPKTIQQLQGAAELVAAYGVPLVQELILKLGSKPNPTVADFEALGADLPDLESYFADKPDGNDTDASS